MKPADPRDVTLCGAVFALRQKKTRDCLAAFPVDRLTRNFPESAGLPSDAEPRRRISSCSRGGRKGFRPAV